MSHAVTHVVAHPMLRRLLGALAVAAAALVPVTSAVAADMSKVVRYVFPASETGFDPAGAQDLYSGTIEQADLRDAAHLRLSRAPGQARAAHRGSHAAGHRGRQGLYAQAQEGHLFLARSGVQGQEARARRRRLRLCVEAADRPQAPSPWAWLVEGKIQGLDALAEAAKKGGKFDYDAKIPGFETPDKYTLRIRLNNAD